MGQPCGIVSAVGNDDFGTLNIERLQTDGVDVSAISVHPTAATGSAFVRYRPDGNRDFIFNIKHSACSAIALTPEAEKLIETADHLHIMGSALFSESIVTAIHEATMRIKAKGGTVSFDPNIRKEMLDLPGMRDALVHALEHTDLFMPSGPEIFLFTKALDERQPSRSYSLVASRQLSLSVALKAQAISTSLATSQHQHSRWMKLIQPAQVTALAQPSSRAGCAVSQQRKL